MLRIITTYGLVLLLAACSAPNGRYQQHHDSTPQRLPSAAELQDPVPRIEAKSRGGNKDYYVHGKFYQVLDNADNFRQSGIASWYGNKFHGHLTSNGEIYDMYSMSAAHKSLPLPTYVRVTNHANNKSVIVRVNDRGPFHQDRIIDLSYSAAYKLGMLATGTAEVTIEALTNEQQFVAQPKAETSVAQLNNPEPLQDHQPQFYIQVFATRNEVLAKDTANGLSSLYQLPVSWPENQGIFRIQIGPFDNSNDADEMLANLKQNGYPQAYKKSQL